MSAPNRDKLKSALLAIPPGFIVDSAWLERHQVSRFLARNYVNNGWMERLARGVFRRPDSQSYQAKSLSWEKAVLSLQHIMEYPVHLGGSTALALQGYSHYLQLGGNAPVWLYGMDIPGWLTRLSLNVQVETRKTTLFTNPNDGLIDDIGSNTQVSQLLDWTFKMSVPERAILEALDELPDRESFHNLDMVFEGLTTLRPKLLTTLLKDCNKIKVTRLFFVFADRHNHAWRKRLDPKKFNLGSGDRALVQGGKIHPSYRIMVPKEFARSIEGNNHGA